MTQRKQFVLTPEQIGNLIEASKPVPYLVMGGVAPTSPQENANAAWAILGEEMGFNHMTARPVRGKKWQSVFTAVPN
jgi:hypothetical protein